MDQRLKDIYLDNMERLDRYFHNRLKKHTISRIDLESHKKSLLSDLYILLTACSHNSNYDNYEPKKLLWIKAEKAFDNYIRKLERHRKMFKYYGLPETPDEEQDNPDPEESKKMKEVSRWMSMDTPAARMLQLRAGGYTYTEIAEIFDCSTNAARMKFYRIKKIIKAKF